MLAKALVVLHQFLEVHSIVVILGFTYITARIAGITKAVEGVLGIGRVITIGIDTTIQRDLQAFDDVDIQEAIHIDIGLNRIVIVQAGIRDTVALLQVGTYIAAAKYHTITIVTYRTVFITIDSAFAIADIDRIDRRDIGYLSEDVGTTRRIFVGAVRDRASEINITAYVQPIKSLVAGLEASRITTEVIVNHDTIGIKETK